MKNLVACFPKEQLSNLNEITNQSHGFQVEIKELFFPDNFISSQGINKSSPFFKIKSKYQVIISQELPSFTKINETKELFSVFLHMLPRDSISSDNDIKLEKVKSEEEKVKVALVNKSFKNFQICIEVWGRTRNFFKKNEEFMGVVSFDLEKIGVENGESLLFEKVDLKRVENKGKISVRISSCGVGLRKKNFDEIVLNEKNNSIDENSINNLDYKFFESKQNTNSTKGGETVKKKKRNFKILRRIGKGGFGEVFLIRKKTKKRSKKNNESNKIKKKTTIQALKRIYCKTEKEVNNAMREVFYLTTMNNKNIIKYYDIFFEDFSFGPFKYSVSMTMKYYKLGDLRSYLQKQAEYQKKLPTLTVLSYLLQLVEGVKCIHSENIIHRDLKPSNILMDNNFRTIVIADFGLIKKVKENEKTKTVTKGGTQNFLPPEYFTNETSGGKPDKKYDIWALGCIYYQIMTLKFNRMFYLEIFKDKYFYNNIITELSKNFPKEIAELNARMLECDPKKRPDSEEILRVLKIIEKRERRKSSAIKEFTLANMEEKKTIENEEGDEESFYQINMRNKIKKLKRVVKNLRFKTGIYNGEVSVLTNLPDGKGKLKFSLNEFYDGQFCHGEFEGFGIFRQKNGAQYTGNWKNSLRHGKGTQIFGGGSIYNGDWKFNKRSGIGEKINMNGTYYYGKWKNDEIINRKNYVKLGEIGNWLKKFGLQKFTKRFIDLKIESLSCLLDFIKKKEDLKIIFIKPEEEKDIEIIWKEIQKQVKIQKKNKK